MSELPPPSTPPSEFFSPIMLENDDDYDTGIPVQNPPKAKVPKVPKTEAAELRERRFSAILLNVKELQKNLNKTLLHPEKYPRLELPSDLDPSIPIETDYLEPASFREGVSFENKFYLEIMGSVAYSLHHPAISSTSSLERYISIQIVRYGSLEDVPYNAFCVVEAKVKDEIPVHYGQSAHLRVVGRRLTPAEREMNTLYRQAMIYTLNSKNTPTEVSQTAQKITQCAEVIAWPFIMEFVRDSLHGGQKFHRLL